LASIFYALGAPERRGGGSPLRPQLLHLTVDDFTFSTRAPLGLYRRSGLDTAGILEFLRRWAPDRVVDPVSGDHFTNR
jgi:hypothetical protein